MNWKPIETAPGPIGCDSMFVVSYEENEKYPDQVWQTADGVAYHRVLRTHWMPLPEPPVK